MTELFRIRLLKSLRVDGSLAEAGAVVQVDADAAERLCKSGRARLADPGDLATLCRVIRPPIATTRRGKILER